MFEIIVNNKNDSIVDRVSCNWLLMYHDKPDDINSLVKYCENKIHEYSYKIYLMDSTNIDQIKKTIIDQINNIDSVSDIIDYLKNKGYRLQQDFGDISWTEREVIENELEKFESLKNFLLKYMYSENYFEFSS